MGNWLIWGASCPELQRIQDPWPYLQETEMKEPNSVPGFAERASATKCNLKSAGTHLLARFSRSPSFLTKYTALIRKLLCPRHPERVLMGSRCKTKMLPCARFGGSTSSSRQEMLVLPRIWSSMMRLNDTVQEGCLNALRSILLTLNPSWHSLLPVFHSAAVSKGSFKARNMAWCLSFPIRLPRLLAEIVPKNTGLATFSTPCLYQRAGKPPTNGGGANLPHHQPPHTKLPAAFAIGMDADLQALFVRYSISIMTFWSAVLILGRHCWVILNSSRPHKTLAKPYVPPPWAWDLRETKFSITWVSLFFSTFFSALPLLTFRSLCLAKVQTISIKFLAGMHSVDSLTLQRARPLFHKS